MPSQAVTQQWRKEIKTLKTKNSKINNRGSLQKEHVKYILQEKWTLKEIARSLLAGLYFKAWKQAYLGPTYFWVWELILVKFRVIKKKKKKEISSRNNGEQRNW